MKYLFHFCYLAFLFLFTIPIIAQDSDPSAEYRVSEKDLQQMVYEKDSLAPAVVLYEYGKSFFTQSDYSIITEYKKKIKIVKVEGYEYATVKVYLWKGKNGYEKLRKIKAKTYLKENGKVTVVALEKSQIFKENVNEHYDAVTFTLPNIKIGSVLTYSYTLDSPYIYNFHGWEFQEEIPKVYSEYTTSIPANYIYNIKLVGYQKLDVNTSDVQKDCFTYGSASAACAKQVFIMKDIPAFVEEDYMTTKENYISKIEYELMQVNYFDGRVDKISKTWKDADREIKTMTLGKELRKSSVLKDILPKLIVNEVDVLEKAKLIFEFVQQNYTWNQDTKIFTEVSLKKLLKNKSGNIGSLNTLLHNLLNENGIEAYPVVMSTRSNGVPTKLFPVLSEFNYLIVKVYIDGKEYLLDASDTYIAFGQIPFRCLNSYGRQIDFKKGSSWVSLETNKTSIVYLDFNLKFTSASTIEGTLKTGFTGYHALLKKNEYYPNPDSYIEGLEEVYPTFEINNYKLNSAGVDAEKFKESFSIKKTFEFEGLNGLYLDPFFYKFFTVNPFKLQNRTYPVDFGYKDSYMYKLTLDVGDFYTIGEVPENFKLSLPDKKGDITCNSMVIETQLTMIFKINFRESKYSPVLYEGLKKLMEKAVATQLNTIIILNKK